MTGAGAGECPPSDALILRPFRPSCITTFSICPLCRERCATRAVCFLGGLFLNQDTVGQMMPLMVLDSLLRRQILGRTISK